MQLTAKALGYAKCTTCGELMASCNGSSKRCPLCNSAVNDRKKNGITRSWCYLISALAFYVPANVLPIMESRSLFGAQQDTILSGVVFLWSTGSQGLALIVFIASVIVPVAKILLLAFILISTGKGGVRNPRQLTALYRFLEHIGKWSMLDVFVVAVLVGLVQAKAIATMSPGPGVVAFSAVVILSMMATHAFDTREIWDAADESAIDFNRQQPVRTS